MRIIFDPADLLADMQRAQRGHDAGLARGLNRVANVGLQAKQQQINKTYARPPGDWVRTGDWRQGQHIKMGVKTAEVLTQGPAEVYEGSLSRLRTFRRNPAAEEAKRVIEPQVGAVFLAEYLDATGLSGGRKGKS